MTLILGGKMPAWLTRRTAICVLTSFGLLFVAAEWANARNSLKFEGFLANIHDILSGISGYCRKYPSQMSFSVSSADYETELFRKACGEGLLRKQLPFGDWGVVYSEAAYPDGRKSIFAVGKQFVYSGREYLLVIGEERFVRFPGDEKQEVILRPAAILNQRDGNPTRWIEVINYVDPKGDGWNVRTGSISDFSVGLRVEDENVHSLWQRVVATDFGQLVRNMKDLNWPG